MEPKHILVIRTSALGDVAMTVPVLKQLLQQYPALQLTVLTSPAFTPLFEPLERTIVYTLEKRGKHKGLLGIYRLFRELKAEHTFDAVADLHNVLRSILLRSLFKLAGIRTAKIDKGRKEKKELTSKQNKKLVQLKTSFQRYADVFSAIDLPFVLDTQQGVYTQRPLSDNTATLFQSGKKHIGIAPFAKHEEKMYPTEKTLVVISSLLSEPNNQVFLLGGGKDEIKVLAEWEKQFPGVVNLAGKFSFKEELAIISHLDVLISMDSANMHLASLFGVPVVSVWGATHPYAGFYGWGQKKENAVQMDLYCRPCSVFGNKPCYRGDHACMEQLPESWITTKALTHSST
ncbi:MAG TPA: glycosyltransferase family 9 protein [Chitinophagaceae bacterium]|nr:glycosyltransferase family 9 protein [Chitinophagaceae bacterium]